ncbi:MAG: hypothetical protein JXA82_05495 [Sedimentisphaerales bacterium]|nr:hypothetical protein [Sedimentisphaerales bacterium]
MMSHLEKGKLLVISRLPRSADIINFINEKDQVAGIVSELIFNRDHHFIQRNPSLIPFHGVYALQPGVVEKISAMASYDYGDARKAVALLAKSAFLAEQRRTKVNLELDSWISMEFS